MHRITAIFSLLLALCLTACMTAGNLKTENLNGLWKSGEQFFYLAEDGSLCLMRNSESAGQSWSFDGSVLTLVTLKAPGEEPEEQKLFLQKRGLFGLEFRTEDGKNVEWSRSYKSVGLLEGTLFFRERMMLPPDVQVHVQLRTLEGEKIAGQSMVHADGHGELSFKVCYLKADFDEEALLHAAVFYGREPLFATPEHTTAALDSKPAVLLHHAVPSQKKDLPLQGTYWRLKELGGKPAESFEGQPEAHLILREGEASGSDGCNNFFMSWEASGKSIHFAPGGATLRLCPKGEEQAQNMLQMFPKVKEWSISGSELELRTEDSMTAVFEAVEM